MLGVACRFCRWPLRARFGMGLVLPLTSKPSLLTKDTSMILRRNPKRQAATYTLMENRNPSCVVGSQWKGVSVLLHPS